MVKRKAATNGAARRAKKRRKSDHDADDDEEDDENHTEEEEGDNEELSDVQMGDAEHSAEDDGEEQLGRGARGRAKVCSLIVFCSSADDALLGQSKTPSCQSTEKAKGRGIRV